ncbi:uncharacterized protein LOC121411152 [Lytechinus variegatus]|uniref:uncharacterized protein LOC121411152 n=1 Tax=Lytechinus variegatus TaxID=7654 RepID=UPI001BB121AF|nr:uncharacterized protein LOC121411152 [Lytechinus variegatus]
MKMPPKKKRQLSINTKQGIARAHLEAEFSTLPPSKEDLRNGHVLNLYILSCKNRSETERRLSAQYLLSDVDGYSSDISISRVQGLCNRTLEKYKKLTNPKEFQVFSAICNESFILPEKNTSNKHTPSPAAQVPQDHNSPSTSTDMKDSALSTSTETEIMDNPPSTSSTPSASVSSNKSSIATRSSSKVLTPRKQKLKKRLLFMSSSRAELLAKHTALKAKLKTPKRVINQSLKRKQKQILLKDKKIKELQNQLNDNAVAIELEATRMKLNKLKKAHRELLKANKRKKNYVSVLKHQSVVSSLARCQDEVKDLETQNLVLKENIEAAEQSSISAKFDKKTYSGNTRMKVFDCIVNKTPTANIPILLEKFHKRNGLDLESVPQRSTVELMARELGAIAELQTAEMIMDTNNLTMGFDATTQEETHINSIHFTSKDKCLAAAVDVLAGGTAEDYATHICSTVDNLADTYCYFNNDANLNEAKDTMVANITNTLTDRCASNHAAIRQVNSEWGKTLTELNCHLHPLDTIATAVRSALKQHEESRGRVYGKDCVAGNIVVQMNKMRYKCGKGDPRGVVSFLDSKGIPRGVLPRYRGNRLHILFHISGKLIEFYDDFVELLSSGTSCGGLRSAVLHEFKTATAKVELQVLGP